MITIKKGKGQWETVCECGERLPFFEYRPDRKFDGFYDGCKGWD